MTEVQDATDRKAKRLRRIARVLTLTWAGCCTLWILAWVFAPWISWPERYWRLSFLDWLTIAAWALAPWVAAALALRWRHAGVVVLPLASLLLPSGVLNTPPQAAGLANSYALLFLDLLLGCLLAPMFLLSVVASILPPLWSRRVERQRLGGEFYEAAKRYHRTGESLQGVDLSRCDLTGIELSKADLEEANLAEANLERATLLGARLVAANLRDANLPHANLEESDISYANLFRAKLQDANLKAADLRSAHLHRADLRGAVLREANLEEADLGYANLEGATLESAHLGRADLDDTTAMPKGWEETVASKPADEPPPTARMRDDET
jgi:uncharacterized protein YjbI with pentapeptide repeats